jgi:hypothetical protein
MTQTLKNNITLYEIVKFMVTFGLFSSVLMPILFAMIHYCPIPQLNISVIPFNFIDAKVFPFAIMY